MSCQYGCSSEDIDLKCVRCGHPKKWHLSMHPHACKGVHDKNGVHVINSCSCTGFRRVDPDQDPYENGRGIKPFASNEELAS